MSANPSSVQVDLDYVKSPPGILKIVEFVFLLIAFACLADTSYGYSRYHFFLFVTVTLWLAVIFLFALFITKLYEKVNVPWVILMIMFHGVACLGLLIASSLIADTAAKFHNNKVYYNKTFCDYYKYCGNFDAAAAFGFFSLIAFALDCAFYVWKLLGSQRSGGQTTSASTDQPKTEPAFEEGLP